MSGYPREGVEVVMSERGRPLISWVCWLLGLSWDFVGSLCFLKLAIDMVAVNIDTLDLSARRVSLFIMR